MQRKPIISRRLFMKLGAVSLASLPLLSSCGDGHHESDDGYSYYDHYDFDIPNPPIIDVPRQPDIPDVYDPLDRPTIIDPLDPIIDPIDPLDPIIDPIDPLDPIIDPIDPIPIDPIIRFKTALRVAEEEYKANAIVTYSSIQPNLDAVREAKEKGLEVIMGIHDLDSEEEWENAISAAPYVDFYCVGNSRFGKRYSIDRLEEKIELIKRRTGKPASTSDNIAHYLLNHYLVRIGEWIFPNSHPPKEIEDPKTGTEYVLENYSKLLEISDGRQILLRTGMPHMPRKVQDKFYSMLIEQNLNFVYERI